MGDHPMDSSTQEGGTDREKVPGIEVLWDA